MKALADKNKLGDYMVNAATSSIKEVDLQEITKTVTVEVEEELKSITGIGDSTAKKIIEYRVANGKFNSIEDIKNVSRDRGK